MLGIFPVVCTVGLVGGILAIAKGERKYYFSLTYRCPQIHVHFM